MIYIRTCAYNAESTLARAVESVLSQTYTDFRYYLLDNGSTDKTGEMIRDYAEKDERIVPFYNKKNMVLEENPQFWSLNHDIADGDYFVILDSDDYYEPTFFEEMLAFVEAEHLDVAACGTEFMDKKTGACVGRKVLDNSVILESEIDYSLFFPYVHWNLRQVWGKIYSAKAAHSMYAVKRPDWWPKAYGGDTLQVLAAVGSTQRFGVYAKELHHYEMSSQSVSHQWKEGREQSDFILHIKTCDFLINKCDHISDTNRSFLALVYLNAIKDTLDVLAKAKMEDAKKLEICASVFGNAITQSALEADLSQFEETPTIQPVVLAYRRAFLDWTLNSFDRGSAYDKTAFVTFASSFNEYLGGMLTGEQVVGLFEDCPQVLRAFLLKEYEEVVVRIEKAYDGDLRGKEAILILGQNAAALCSDEEKYIDFSKRLIGYHIENGQGDIIKAELDEWLQMMPNDSDFIEMRNKI